MAIYRLSAQVISRSSGRSATAAAAYRSGERLEDRRTGQTHDYERRGGVVHQEIISPDNAPDWMRDRNALWNAVEVAEKRKDAQLCREVQLALPYELDASQRLALVRSFVGREFVARGMVADVAIHAPHRKGDHRNHHAHVMLTLRTLTTEGFGKKERGWNERGALAGWRKTWADEVNRALERAGEELRVDHRTLEAQRLDAERKAVEARTANDNHTAEIVELEAARLDRDPEPKVGHIATALERRGEATERGDIWRTTVARNLDRFRSWLTLQRDRLEEFWRRAEAAMQDRQHEAQAEQADDRDGAKEDGKPRSYTQEERDRLLGRNRERQTPRNRERGRDRGKDEQER